MFDPAFRYRTITTAHFSIHFHQGEDRTARRLASIAEDVWRTLPRPLGAMPPTRVVLADQTEIANGFATPVPYNTVMVTAVWRRLRVHRQDRRLVAWPRSRMNSPTSSTSIGRRAGRVRFVCLAGRPSPSQPVPSGVADRGPRHLSGERRDRRAPACGRLSGGRRPAARRSIRSVGPREWRADRLAGRAGSLPMASASTLFVERYGAESSDDSPRRPRAGCRSRPHRHSSASMAGLSAPCGRTTASVTIYAWPT